MIRNRTMAFAKEVENPGESDGPEVGFAEVWSCLCGSLVMSAKPVSGPRDEAGRNWPIQEPWLLCQASETHRR